MRQTTWVMLMIAGCVVALPCAWAKEGGQKGPSSQAYEHANEHAAFKRGEHPGKSPEAQQAVHDAHEAKHAAKQAAHKAKHAAKQAAHEAKQAGKTAGQDVVPSGQ